MAAILSQPECVNLLPMLVDVIYIVVMSCYNIYKQAVGCLLDNIRVVGYVMKIEDMGNRRAARGPDFEI